MCSERYNLYQRVVMLKNHLICLSYQISVTLFIDGGKTQNGKLRMQARVKDKPVRKEKNDHIVLKLWGTTIVNQDCLQQVESPFLVSFPDCKEYTHQRDKMRYNTTIFQCFASVLQFTTTHQVRDFQQTRNYQHLAFSLSEQQNQPESTYVENPHEENYEK